MSRPRYGNDSRKQANNPSYVHQPVPEVRQADSTPTFASAEGDARHTFASSAGQQSERGNPGQSLPIHVKTEISVSSRTYASRLIPFPVQLREVLS